MRRFTVDSNRSAKHNFKAPSVGRGRSLTLRVEPETADQVPQKDARSRCHKSENRALRTSKSWPAARTLA
jgi:hypothetical protein